MDLLRCTELVLQSRLGSFTPGCTDAVKSSRVAIVVARSETRGLVKVRLAGFPAANGHFWIHPFQAKQCCVQLTKYPG
jgi:hypothetical protein